MDTIQLVPAEGLLASLTSCPASVIQERGLRPQPSTFLKWFSPIFLKGGQKENVELNQFLTNVLTISTTLFLTIFFLPHFLPFVCFFVSFFEGGY